MWDWMKALFDGGFTWLFTVGVATFLATGIYRHARDWRRETWEEAVVLAVMMVLFSIYPAWHLLTDDEWRRFVIGEEPSAFTYGKMLWVNIAGVALGRIAYSAVPAWLMRM